MKNDCDRILQIRAALIEAEGTEISEIDPEDIRRDIKKKLKGSNLIKSK